MITRRYILFSLAVGAATLGGFLVGLVGRNGNVHHASHVATAVLGTFLLVTAFILLVWLFVCWLDGE